MKILVTGGAGFIGSHVVDAYIKHGHTVVIVDNLSTGERKNLHQNAIFYPCDITSPDFLSIFQKEKPNVVNHHAAQVNVRRSLENPIADAQTNILGLLNVLSCSVKTSVQKFIFISSGGAIYGDAAQIPTPETAPSKPLSPYGASKYSGEQFVQLFQRLYGLSYAILRYANVYGPRQNPKGEAGVVALFIDALLHGKQSLIFGTGEQTRDYIHVHDVVAANILALMQGENKILNIGTGKETTVNALYSTLSSLLQAQRSSYSNPSYTAHVSGEVFRGCLDCRSAKKELGWEARISLSEGLAKTVQWFQETYQKDKKEKKEDVA